MSAIGEDLPLLSLATRIREPVDVLLTEGFMRQPAPKIEISRAERSRELIAPADELLAVMANHDVSTSVPVHGLGDHAAVADAIDRLVARWNAMTGANRELDRMRHRRAPQTS